MIVYVTKEIINNITNITGVFNTEYDAWIYNVKSILYLIQTYWDIPFNSRHNYQAYHINDNIINMRHRACICYFNSLTDADRYSKKFDVFETEYNPQHNQVLGPINSVDIQSALSYNPNVINIVPSPIFTVQPPSSNIISNMDEPDETNTYKALFPGAKCRGPSCTYESEYAYADKPDGTFVCNQCKMFGFKG